MTPPDPTNMDAPVTRRELHDGLAQFAEHLLAELDRRLDAREQRLRADLERAADAREQRQAADLARHVHAIEESARTQIRALDDKYRDLPNRVAALEARAAPPPKRRRRG